MPFFSYLITPQTMSRSAPHVKIILINFEAGIGFLRWLDWYVQAETRDQKEGKRSSVKARGPVRSSSLGKRSSPDAALPACAVLPPSTQHVRTDDVSDSRVSRILLFSVYSFIMQARSLTEGSGGGVLCTTIAMSCQSIDFPRSAASFFSRSSRRSLQADFRGISQSFSEGLHLMIIHLPRNPRLGYSGH
ncbi:hypothetical protein PENSPDRAFT_469073 [Peniophora sp. CONT]|nr:hypothetical protein PENSPDRAFT_469073 [Peniophora sp. CONT]